MRLRGKFPVRRLIPAAGKGFESPLFHWSFTVIVYTRANGYGNIDTNAPEFQLGRRLYEIEVLFAKLEKGETISPEQIKEVIQWYAELINNVGMLRYDYECLRRVVEGKAEFREK